MSINSKEKAMNMFGIAGFPVPGRAFMAFAAAASVAVSASAATTYTITTTAGDTYESPLAIDSATVSVDDGNGAVDMSFADAKATFSAGAVFRKRGPGYLRGSPSMFTFTGEVRIEEGGYLAITNRCLGPTAKASANPVVVSNGASLVFCTTAATCATDTFLVYNAITFEGPGYEGRGALSLDLGTDCMKNCGFRGNWTLSGDATIGVYKSSMINAPCEYFYMNNHSLVFRQKGNAGVFCTPKRLRPGGKSARIVFDGKDFECRCQETAKDWWTGDGANEFVYTNGAHSLWYNFDARPSWTIVANDGTTLAVSGGVNHPSDLAMDPATGFDQWGGLRINTDVFRVSGTAERRGAWFKGFVAGRGGIYATDLWLKLSCPTNAFSGSVVIGSAGHDSFGRGLALYANGAAPATCAGIVVTNATTYLGKAEAFALPKIDYEVSSGTHSISGLATRIETPMLRKTGAGTLDMSTIPVAVSGTLEVRGGTLKLNGAAVAKADVGKLYSGVPGLWCGTSPGAGGAGKTDSAVYSNFVDSAFTMLGRRAYPPWTKNRPTVWGGYIWNRSPTNETWTFAVSVYAMGRVYIDGSELVVNDNYGAVNMANKLMKPGFHKFRFAVNPREASTPGYRALSNATYTWAGGMGLGIDRFGRKSTNSADYIFPTNAIVAGTSGFGVEGGDGSLFTRDNRDRSDFSEEELLAVARPTSVASLVMGPTATLDLCGDASSAPLSVDRLTGGGTVANGSLHVCGTWRLDSDGRTPVPLTLAGGTLSFGADAMLDFDGDAVKAGRSGRVIATAVSEISGELPSVSPEMADKGWRVRVDGADRRRLLLVHETGAILIFM